MEGFETKEKNPANGGEVNTNKKSELMSYEEYTGKKGTDGFSKKGGK